MEKQIEADVSFYLGWRSNKIPFTLLDIDEQETGADKLSKVTVAICILPLPPEQRKRQVVEDKMPPHDPTLFWSTRNGRIRQ